jgi:hypothetical protein
MIRSLTALALAVFATDSFASSDCVVTFNEIQYNPAGTSEAGEYVELVNQMGIKTDISGWRIDGIGYTFPANTIVNPGAYIVVAKTPGAGQFGPFPGSIQNSGQRLQLINHSDRLMDEIDFGDDAPWPAGADGSGFTLAKRLPLTDSGRHANWTVSVQQNGTPGTVNFPDAGAPPPVTTVNLFNLNNTWRFNQNGPAYDATWAQTAHAVGGSGSEQWQSGAGAIAYETSATVDIATTLRFPGLNSPYVMTYYFETEFSVTAGQLANLAALKIRHALDDGAVIYINGHEATRINMPGGVINSATTASANVEAGIALSAYVPLPATALVPGTNRLSVEVHQFAAGNSDVVWGAQLDMDVLDPVPGAAPPLRFNEIPGATEAAWWVEIVNTGAAPVDLAGIIVNAGGDAARDYAIPSGSLAGGGLLLLNEATLGFRPADGEKVFLFTSGKSSLMDARQQTGRLRGRAADRGGEWAYPSAATPGAANAFDFDDRVVISEIMYNPPALAPVPAVPPTFQSDPLISFGDSWRYNSADENLPADWAAAAHPVGGNWRSGPGPIGVESSPLPVPLATVISPYVAATVTHFFERDFTVTAQQLATATSLEITHMIDDGAIFYLNGVEIPSSRFGMPGTNVGPETLASTGVDNAVLNSVVVPTSGLVAGTNRLSVEVHQGSTGSSDLVFGLKLDARVQLTPGVSGQPLRNSDNQWIELTNRSAAPVDLSGWDFEDGLTFLFPPGTTLAAGERACVVRDSALFSAAFPAARVLGVFDGSLSRTGEHIVLRDARRNTVDEVRYFDSGRWPEDADGGGASLELRDLDSDNMQAGAWAASDESGRTGWSTYTYTGTAAASNGGPDGQWSEFNMGMMAAGEIWIDDVSVIENPSGAATQKISDPGFNNAAAWRRRGNHRHSQVIPEPGNPGNSILRLVATGPTEHMHNQIETTLASAIANGQNYQIRFRARWVGGGNQLHTRCYFNRLARVSVIDRVENPGTPGTVNSRSVANAGPAFSGLKHSPPVPAAGAVTTVSCIASDPDGVGAMTLFYSVNGGAFASVSMSSTGGGLYSGSVPGQAAGAVVQFYIQGSDSQGASEYYPAAGASSRALYKVNDNTAATNGLHNFRLITTNADRDWMHTAINVMSNDRIECTIIDRENDIYYGAGVRLKSSERGRNQTARVGYNIDFPSDALFRGTLGGVAVDRSEGVNSGQQEILYDIMISNSGGPVSRYFDLIKILSPNAALTRTAVLQLARYDDVFLDSQYENGSDGRLYEYELVYYPTTADANGNKIPEPDGVVGVNVQNHGDDPERYRWQFLNKINREADDFAPIMNFCKVFSLSGAAFETALAERVDVDEWLRGMAYAVLSGAGDNAAAGSQHNGIYYAKPDGRVVFLPHDMDFSFDAARSITANPQCSTLVSTSAARRRLYYGHLHDIISTTYNNGYMSIWTSHLATLDSAQPWSSHLSYMTSRSSNVLSQINAGIPNVAFAVTTANPLTVASSTATITGNGWVNVRSIRLQGGTEPLALTWTGNTTWQAVVPAPPGQSTVTLEAVNFSGVVIGTASLTINNTSQVVPASADNVVVSEIMYHPADPTAAEFTAGYTDDNFFEYLEIQNISAAVVDLTGVRFTGGVDFNFAAAAQLQPGGRLTVASSRSAFQMRYPGASATLAAGEFINGTNLNNAGEGITLISAGGSVIKDFSYDDNPPWPTAPDGDGFSLVLINPAANPDHNIPANWRSSAAVGGNPGSSDAVSLTGDPGDDLDHDGQDALLEHGLGTSDTAPGQPAVTVAVGPDGHLRLTYTRRLGADDAIVEPQISTDLISWDGAAFGLESETPLGDGTSLVVVRALAAAPSGRLFARVEVRQR